MHSMQAGYLEKAQKYTDKALMQLEKLKSKCCLGRAPAIPSSLDIRTSSCSGRPGPDLSPHVPAMTPPGSRVLAILDCLMHPEDACGLSIPLNLFDLVELCFSFPQAGLGNNFFLTQGDLCRAARN